jgi:hypothetical protein
MPMRLLIGGSIAPDPGLAKSRAYLPRVVDASYRAWKIRLVPLAEGLRVVHSSIHGYGVETTRPFRAGETVLAGDGVVYHEADEFDDTYALVLPAVDGGPEFAPDLAADEDAVFFYDLVDQTRWINHSCDPNTKVESEWDGAAGITRTRWVAVRDIPVGVELAYDYAFAASVAEPCNCGAATCRGVICDPDELDELPDHLRRLVRTKRAS